MKKQLIAAVTIASLLGFAGGTAVQAFNLGSILKVGGISILVSKYGDSINDFLNKLLMKNGVGTDYATKVVPIVSVGTGKYIGAVQVIGPSAQVEKVKAVAQLEGEFNGIARANASSLWRRRMSAISIESRASASRQQSISSSDAFPRGGERGRIRQQMKRRPFA